MSAPPAAAQTNPPDPPQDRPPAAAGGPKSTGFLLGLVRRLIDYGKQLAITLRQYPPAASRRPIPRHIGPRDIGLLLTRIVRGLNLAVALETRLLGRARQTEKSPAPACPSPPRRPRTTQPAARRAANPRLPFLPTAAEIAAQVRRRPIGVVLAEICRDFGIVPGSQLWRDLSLAVIANGGNLAALCKHIFTRPLVAITDRLIIAFPEWPAVSLLPAGYATGPP